MQIEFIVLKNICRCIESDHEDEWCRHKDNEKKRLYGSCKEELCPLKSK